MDKWYKISDDYGEVHFIWMKIKFYGDSDHPHVRIKRVVSDEEIIWYMTDRNPNVYDLEINTFWVKLLNSNSIEKVYQRYINDCIEKEVLDG